MTIERIQAAVMGLVEKYHISKVILFGSRADGRCRDDSDVDLIMEFSRPVSLLTLSMITDELKGLLQLEVDLVHGPIRQEDMLEIGGQVVLYAA